MNFPEYKRNFAVLIVDDNEDNIYTLQHRLKRDGYQNLHIARNGIEAVEFIERGLPAIDLILLDIMMPHMNGYDVLVALKDKILAAALRVLMISSEDALESIAQCIKLGADDFLSKPFNSQILNARIGSCVEKQWQKLQQTLHQQQIEDEKAKFSRLLHAVFPASVVKELAETDTVKPKIVKDAAILFADVVSFTHYTETHPIDDVLVNLQDFVDTCETVARKYRIEKIKTIGDAFMAAAGMLEQLENPVLAAVNWANEVIHLMKQRQWQVRVGIDCGDILCGIIGSHEYLFDIWGRPVNTAARIEAITKPSTIYLTHNAWTRVENLKKGTRVGTFHLKGKDVPTDVYEVSAFPIEPRE